MVKPLLLNHSVCLSCVQPLGIVLWLISIGTGDGAAMWYLMKAVPLSHSLHARLQPLGIVP